MSILKITEYTRWCGVCNGSFHRREISNDPEAARIQRDYSLCNECSSDPGVLIALNKTEARWMVQPTLPSWWGRLFLPSIDCMAIHVLKERAAVERRRKRREVYRHAFLAFWRRR